MPDFKRKCFYRVVFFLYRTSKSQKFANDNHELNIIESSLLFPMTIDKSSAATFAFSSRSTGPGWCIDDIDRGDNKGPAGKNGKW